MTKEVSESAPSSSSSWERRRDLEPDSGWPQSSSLSRSPNGLGQVGEPNEGLVPSPTHSRQQSLNVLNSGISSAYNGIIELDASGRDGSRRRSLTSYADHNSKSEIQLNDRSRSPILSTSPSMASPHKHEYPPKRANELQDPSSSNSTTGLGLRLKRQISGYPLLNVGENGHRHSGFGSSPDPDREEYSSQEEGDGDVSQPSRFPRAGSC